MRERAIGKAAEVLEHPRADFVPEPHEGALRDTRGNRRKAAEVLDIGERTLYRKLRDYGIAAEELAANQKRRRYESYTFPGAQNR